MTLIEKTFAVATLGLGLFAEPLFAQATVNVDYKNPTGLTGFRTYQIANIDTTDPLLEGRLAAAIDRQLEMKGWHEVSHNPAVKVTAVLAGNNDAQEYQRFYSVMSGMKWDVSQTGEAAESVAASAPGTLILDMYDAKTGQLIFRGTASDFLTDNTGKNEVRLDRVVDKISSGLPSTGFAFVTTGNFAIPDGNKF